MAQFIASETGNGELVFINLETITRVVADRSGGQVAVYTTDGASFYLTKASGEQLIATVRGQLPDRS